MPDDRVPKQGAESPEQRAESQRLRMRAYQLRELRSRTFEAVALVTAAVALGGALSTIMSLWVKPKGPDPLTQAMQRQREQTGALAVEVARVSDRLDALERKQNTLTKLSEGSKLAARLTEIDVSLRSLRKSVTSMEAAVMDDPSKAIALPLLRKDLDNAKESHQAALLAAREEVARLYDFSKWFIALMITIAVGILTLAIGSFLKPKEAAPSAPDTKAGE